MPFGKAPVAKCWGLNGCSQQHLDHPFHCSSLQDSHCVPPSTAAPGWNRRCPSYRLGTGEDLSTDKLRKLFWFLAAKRSWCLLNFDCCPHMLFFQQPPPAPLGRAADWAVQSVFFHAAIKCHIALSCVFKFYGQVAHKDLHLQSWTMIPKSFPTALSSAKGFLSKG